jgi:peptidoglycan/xylan/chitin deacetylase (PgdA/CDA1 family)
MRGLARRALKRLRRLSRGPVPVILMYHRIADETFDPWALAVAPERFGEQLAWLNRHRKVLSLAEFSGLHAQGKLPAKAVAITFDDGYACNAGPAAELLHRHQTPATIFLATDAIRSGSEFWWDELEHLVLTIDADELALDLPSEPLRVSLGDRQADDRDWSPSAPARTPRQKAFYEIWAALRELDPEEQEAALEQVRRRSSGSDAPRDSHRPMNAAEARGLKTGRIDVGAHSLSHTSLPARTREEKEKEIFGSRDECAAITGAMPSSFAYPFGDFDEESARIIEAAGFRCACTTLESGVGRNADPYALPRLQVWNWTPDQLARALARL